ncbi:hypothetical protein BDR07DRAFT_237129 [Suillus spraguei]|nr:hypothetical protein BDR07DRAFT_237129 [Suillus spraguei]
MKSAMKSTTSRCLLLLVVASCFLVSVAHAPHQLLEERKPNLHARELTVSVPPVGPTTTTPTTTPPTTTPTTTTPQTTSTPSTTSTPPTTSPTQTTTSTPTSSPTTTTPTQTSSTPPPETTAATTPTTVLLPSTTVSVSTNSAGQEFTSTIVITPTPTPSASSTESSSASSSSSGGLGTGSIIGLSVAGGVAVIAIISFFIWKFTRKRFADFDDSTFFDL